MSWVSFQITDLWILRFQTALCRCVHGEIRLPRTVVVDSLILVYILSMEGLVLEIFRDQKPIETPNRLRSQFALSGAHSVSIPLEIVVFEL